jgi:hypothetical protein
MKAYETNIRITSGKKLMLPKRFEKSLPANKNARIIILIDETEDDRKIWNELTMHEFFKGYSKEDEIYDNL